MNTEKIREAVDKFNIIEYPTKELVILLDLARQFLSVEAKMPEKRYCDCGGDPTCEVCDFNRHINQTIDDCILALMKLMPDEGEMRRAIKHIGSTKVPISKIDGKNYHYMNKGDLAKAIIAPHQH